MWTLAGTTNSSGFRLAAMEQRHFRENLLMCRLYSSKIVGMTAT
jgi:hypothetical protein